MTHIEKSNILQAIDYHESQARLMKMLLDEYNRLKKVEADLSELLAQALAKMDALESDLKMRDDASEKVFNEGYELGYSDCENGLKNKMLNISSEPPQQITMYQK